MHDIADFLRSHPPFDTLDDETLESVAASSEIEFHASNAPILDRADATSESAYIVRRGSVELVNDGRLLDLRGEGEMFGYAALLHEGPIGFVARAAEDTLVYRIPAEVIRPVLERPAAARFLATSLQKQVQLLSGQGDDGGPTQGGRRVGDLIRSPPLVLDPSVTVQDAAGRMAEAGKSCVVVDLGDRLGIVTDRDLRTRVVAAGAAHDTPLSEVMTAPARTVTEDRLAMEALLEMLDNGVRHLPVLGRDRRLVGVIDDVDLMASERREPFRLRGQIARAADPAAVAAAAAAIPDTVIAVHDAGLPAPAVSRIIASIHDTVVRRLIELAHQDLGRPAVPYTWLAMGSFGRREPFPSSDVDCALAWEGPDDDDLRRQLTGIAERVLDGVQAAGYKTDRQGALASSRLFARSVDAWEKAARAWVEEPDEGRGLMLMSVVVESTPVWGTTSAPQRLAAAFASAPRHAEMLRRLAASALAERPPTGFMRDFVLHSSGERKGVLDIKRGGLLPIESLARWAGLSAGVAAASTLARLKAAEDAGVLDADDAAVLREAYGLVSALRIEHQVNQLRSGDPPDNLISPKNLPPLTRTALKDAFRGVARVQRGVGIGLGMSGR